MKYRLTHRKQQALQTHVERRKLSRLRPALEQLEDRLAPAVARPLSLEGEASKVMPGVEGAPGTPLTPAISFTIPGDYVADGVGLRGLAAGNVAVAGIPGGSTVVGAYLYYGYLSNGPSGPLAPITFAGNAGSGTLIGSGPDTCWATANSYSFRRNVTTLVPGNGVYAITGVQGGGPNGILAQGASLVVIYRNNALSVKNTNIYEGNSVVNAAGDSVTTLFSGFQAVAPVQAKTTFIVGDGQNAPEAVSFNGVPYPNLFAGGDGGHWDTVTITPAIAVGATNASANISIGIPGDCLQWTAQVVSVASPNTNVLVNNTAADTTAQDTQSETSLSVSGTGNSAIVTVGFNDSGSCLPCFNANSKFTGYSRSVNGGATFTDQGTLPTNPIGDAGDPVLARDNSTGPFAGRQYFATLAFGAPNTIQVFRSTDNGLTWSAPVNGTPGGVSEDKEWMTVDSNAGAGQGNVYLLSRRFAGAQGIYLYRSTDGGLTFAIMNGGAPIVNNVGGNVQGAFVTVGADHAVYAYWFDNRLAGQRLMLRKSVNQGVAFGGEILIHNLLGGGVNGDLGLGGFRSNMFPHAVAHPTNPNLHFVVYNDNPAGVDRADVYVRQSNDGGATWGAQFRVNTDPGTNDNWMPTVAISPNGTKIFITWYDRRLDINSNRLIDKWYRMGQITGTTVTWAADRRLSDVSWLPSFGQDPVVNGVYMGDYDQVVADNNFFYTTWGDNRLPYNPAGTVATRRGTNQADVRFAKIGIASRLNIVAPAVTTAGVAFNITVQALDLNGNLDPNYLGTVSFTSSDPLATLPGATTFTVADAGDRVFSVTLRRSLQRTITATDTVVSSINASASLVVLPAAASRLIVELVAQHTAGDRTGFSVRVVDAFDNTVPNFAGTVTFTHNDPFPGIVPGPYTFVPNVDQGFHYFDNARLFTAGNRTITATSGALTGSATTLIVPDRAFYLYQDAPATVASGTPFTITIYVLDFWNNLVPTYNQLVTWYGYQAPPDIIPANYTFTGADAGIHAFVNETTMFGAGVHAIFPYQQSDVRILGYVEITVTTLGPGPGSGPGSGMGGLLDPLNGIAPPPQGQPIFGQRVPATELPRWDPPRVDETFTSQRQEVHTALPAVREAIASDDAWLIDVARKHNSLAADPIAVLLAG